MHLVWDLLFLITVMLNYACILGLRASGRLSLPVRRFVAAPVTRMCSTDTHENLAHLKASIEVAGSVVRELKAAAADKDEVKAAVDALLVLKAELSALDGTPVDVRSKTNKKKASKASATASEPSEEDGVCPRMEDLVNLCKRKGFIFPSSEIYSPFSGFFDYGPLGTELKNNIRQAWWREFVQSREDVVGLDSSIISSPAIWRASGHVDGFSDPMVDCKESKLRYRADQVFWAKLEQQKEGGSAVYVSVMEADDMQATAQAAAEKKAKEAGFIGPFKPLSALKDLTEAADTDEYARIPSPATGQEGGLTAPREFNLMFQTSVGAVEGGSSVAYLRPETAQGIFTNFANVQRTARMKVPFGIAQVGKAFRNEITPRNYIFRSREFEQMEIEYFVSDKEGEWEEHYKRWLEDSWSWLLRIGLREDMLFRDVKSGGLAHYAKACTDITFRFPFGTQELMGVAARGNYDLTVHANGSGEKLDYFDQAEERRYLPHVIEPSIGLDRLLLALLTSAYHVEDVPAAKGGTEKRTVLALHPQMAPVKVAVFPLVNNKAELTDKARALFSTLQKRYSCEFDTSGAIGRRYRRADEIGTPYCITVDFCSLDDDTVTVRDRDSMEQVRMAISDVPAFLSKKIDGV